MITICWTDGDQVEGHNWREVELAMLRHPLNADAGGPEKYTEELIHRAKNMGAAVEGNTFKDAMVAFSKLGLLTIVETNPHNTLTKKRNASK